MLMIDLFCMGVGHDIWNIIRHFLILGLMWVPMDWRRFSLELVFLIVIMIWYWKERYGVFDSDIFSIIMDNYLLVLIRLKLSRCLTLRLYNYGLSRYGISVVVTVSCGSWGQLNVRCVLGNGCWQRLSWYWGVSPWCTVIRNPKKRDPFILWIS